MFAGITKYGLLSSVMLRTLLLGCCLLALASRPAVAEDGSELWLRYTKTSDPARLAEYRAVIKSVVVFGDSPTLDAARDEMLRGLRGILAKDIGTEGAPTHDGFLLVGTPATLKAVTPAPTALATVGNEGYV